MNENHSNIDKGCQFSLDPRLSEHKECFCVFLILLFTRLAQCLAFTESSVNIAQNSLKGWVVHVGGGKTSTEHSGVGKFS